MTPRAAEELLEAIKPDDHFTRRRMLDAWSRRWVATAIAESPSMAPEQEAAFDAAYGAGTCERVADRALVEQLIANITSRSPRAVYRGQRVVGAAKCLTMHLNVILQEPYVAEGQQESPTPEVAQCTGTLVHDERCTDDEHRQCAGTLVHDEYTLCPVHDR